MSFTPCNRCGEPLLAYVGSACTNPACENAAKPDDPNPYAKTIDGSDYASRTIIAPRQLGKKSALARAFKGIR